MSFFATTWNRIWMWSRRLKNLRYLIPRLRNLKNTVLGELHQVRDSQAQLGSEIKATRDQQGSLVAELQVLRGVQASLLQASVYLVESQQQQGQSALQ